LILLAGIGLGMTMQIQSTEAWMLYTDNAGSMVPSMNLFLQFPAFWNHQMNQSLTTAFLVAWGVELT
jgi:hypothetical protein